VVIATYLSQRRILAVRSGCSRHRDQRPRKGRPPPEGSGACLPTGGCGGPQSWMLHGAHHLLDWP